MAGDSRAGDAFARKVAEALLPRDVTAKQLGMEIQSVGLGSAQLAMAVRPEMLNGHDVVHGGYIFTLADTAMAYACNSYNQNTLAQHAQITFVAPGKAGETLTATAREVTRGKRSGLYDVEVHGDDGRLIAAFRGATRTIAGMVAPALGTAPAD